MDSNNRPQGSSWAVLLPVVALLFIGLQVTNGLAGSGLMGGLIAAFMTATAFVGGICHRRHLVEKAGVRVSPDSEDAFASGVSALGGMIFLLALLAPPAIPFILWVSAGQFLVNLLFFG